MFSRFKMINAISASLLILVLASCSTKKNLDGTPVEDGPVTSVTVAADKTETVSGGTIKLTALVQGSGSYNKFVTWKILKGGGQIKGSVDTAIYTADLAIDNNIPIEIEATSQGDSTKKAVITLTVKLTTSIRMRIYASDNAWKSNLVPTANIPVVLYDANKTLIQQGNTDATGTLTFIGLTPQEYIVTEEVPAGYGVQGLPLDGRKFASRRLPLTTGPVFYDSLSFTNTLAVVNGQVYLDKDFSGIREPKKQNGGRVYDQEGRLIYDEPGVAGAELTLNGTDIGGKPVKKTVKTDGNGRFEIPGLLAGQYTLSEAQPITLGDWDELSTVVSGPTSTPTTITFSHNATDRSDTTNQFILPEGSSVGDLIFAESDLPVTGLVYLDRDRDGYRLYTDGKLIEDPVGIPGITLRLAGVGNAQNAVTVSDKDGKFIFDRAVPAGQYKISEDQPLGYGDGHHHVIGKFTNIDGKEVDIPAFTGNNAEITVPQLPLSGIDPSTKPAAPATDSNAPVKPAPITTTYPVEFSDTLSNIMGTVFQDDNKDGIRDGDGINVDPGLVLNVPMRLTGTDINGRTVEKTTTLDEAGEFYFADLLQGTYQIVQLEQPANYLDGKTRPGLIDNARVGTSGINRIDAITLPAGKDAGGTQYWIIYLTSGKILPGYNSSTNDSYSFAEIANK
jgi:large repetitive protein